MKPWWETVDWGHGYVIEADESIPLGEWAGDGLIIRPIAYAECQGPDDPACGRARFSSHGCNGGRPRRADFKRWWDENIGTDPPVLPSGFR